MTVKDLLPFGRTAVPVSRGVNPVATFQDDINRLFQDYFGDTSVSSWLRGREPGFSVNPAIDIAENEQNFIITAELPGIDPKDIQVSASEGYVTIKGEKQQQEKVEREGYFRQERSFGEFQRVVALPDTANLDKVDANFKHGVLTLHIPKKAGTQSKAHRIEIKQAA